MNPSTKSTSYENHTELVLKIVLPGNNLNCSLYFRFDCVQLQLPVDEVRYGRNSPQPGLPAQLHHRIVSLGQPKKSFDYSKI